MIQVFTSQCCCEVKLDRTIGLSFNLQVRQVAGTPWDSSYLHRKSPRLHSLESDQGPLTPGQRLLEPCPAANSVPSRNSEFLPSPPPPAPRGAPQQPRKNGNLGASAPTVGAARSAQISSDHRVQARPQPNSGPTYPRAVACWRAPVPAFTTMFYPRAVACWPAYPASLLDQDCKHLSGACHWTRGKIGLQT